MPDVVFVIGLTASGKSTFIKLYGLEEAKRKLEYVSNEAQEAIAHYYDNAEFFNSLIYKLKEREK